MKMVDRERMQWKRRFDFLFTCFGYTVGLGNVWRFPEQCYRNGGGAFLFPYFLTVIFCTVPMAFLQMSLGQFSSEGPIRVWKFSPIFIGVGWAIMFISFVTNIYYITPIMFSMYYMMVSFVNIGGTLPWQHCRETDEWSTDECLSGNISAEENYWNLFVLGEHESEGMHDLGPVVGRNLCLLLIMWIIVYYCCVRGIRSIAKVIYVTATFPFGLILILLVRGMTLSGYDEGLRYYLKADWSKMSDMKIWASAASQAMYSMGVSYGSYFILASHNKFHNNVFVDAISIGIVNTLTSFFLGLVVFSFIGHGSYKLNISIENMIDQGPGLLFVTYIQGLTQLPGSSVWSVLFFLMVFTLGLDSQFVMVWTMASSIEDCFPNFKFGKRKKYFILLALCTVMFLLGIPLVTKGGIHMMVLMDRYVANIVLTVLILCQSVSVCWVYGLDNFIRDIEMMIGKKPAYFWWYWKGTWLVTVPVLCLFIFIASCIGYAPSSYRGKVIPPGGEAIGWLITITPLVIIIVGGIIQIRRYKGIKAAMTKTPDWGPRCEEDRDGEYASPIELFDRSSRKISDLNIEGLQPEMNETFQSPANEGEHKTEFKGREQTAFYKVIRERDDNKESIRPRGRTMNQAVLANSHTHIIQSNSDGNSSLNSLDSTLEDALPTPHGLAKTNAEQAQLSELADEFKDAIDENLDESLAANGYITPISKRPAPRAPS